MSPRAFYDLVDKLSKTRAFGEGRKTQDWVAEKAATALYRLGRSGNAAGIRDVAINCGCSEGSVTNWTNMTLEGLLELEHEVVTFATEDERQKASAWVQERSGVKEWGKGWAVVDGTMIKLAWKPALHPRQYYNYKVSTMLTCPCSELSLSHRHMFPVCHQGDYALNIALVMLPHSLRIIEYVIGFPGSAQDSRVWASGSNILKRPRQHLDEGEFVWTDGGYGFSPFTLGPFTHKAAETSKDLRRFNQSLSSIRVRAEHGIGLLKNRFRCLLGYRGNLYRDEDVAKSGKVVLVCIVAHTFASRYDRPEDVAEYLISNDTNMTESENLANDLIQYKASTATYRRRRCDAQLAYEAHLEETLGMSNRQVDELRKQKGISLREEMFTSLFSARGWIPEDTNPESRRRERTVAALDQYRASRNQRARELRAARAT
jgi:hypothetical protein